MTQITNLTLQWHEVQDGELLVSDFLQWCPPSQLLNLSFTKKNLSHWITWPKLRFLFLLIHSSRISMLRYISALDTSLKSELDVPISYVQTGFQLYGSILWIGGERIWERETEEKKTRPLVWTPESHPLKGERREIQGREEIENNTW